MALTHLETHIDLSPASPKVITDSFTINCTETSVRYKINQDIPHAFLVRTSADITIRNASNTVLTRDDDFYLKQTKRDVYYSKAYSLSSIFSEIQFAEVGVYTVTRHMCVGTYITASYLNALKLAIADIAASIASMALTIAGHTTTLNSHTTTLSDHSSRVTDLEDGLADEITARAAADTALQGNIDTHANNTTDAHGATSAATANKIAIRDANARMQAAAGAASSDVVNKGQMDAALEAMALSAGTGNVNTTDTSATDGEIVVESGTTGKAIKKSGKSIGNASGNVPLANGTKCENLFAARAGAAYMGATTTTTPLSEIADAAPNGKSLFYVQYNSGGSAWHYPESNTIATNWFYAVDRKDGYIIITSFSANVLSSLAQWTRKCNSPDWGDWTQLTDAKGQPLLAPTLHDVTASRALSTTYTNNTGTEMIVSVTLYSGTQISAFATVSGAIVSRVAAPQMKGTMIFVVPPGKTYLLTPTGSISIETWIETY